MEVMSAWIKKSQSLSRVLHTDAMALRLGTVEATAIISNLHPENVSDAFNVGFYKSAICSRRNSMLNRVLYDGL